METHLQFRLKTMEKLSQTLVQYFDDLLPSTKTETSEKMIKSQSAQLPKILP